MGERSREAYKGTSLIARTYRKTVRGKAWCDGREIASIEGLTEPDVLTALRELVDAAFTVETIPGSVRYPSTKAYEMALQSNLEHLTDKYRLMLCAHYKAPDRTLTMRDLADAAEYPTWTSADRHYNTVGRMLGESMLFQPRARASGFPIWMLMIAEGANKDDPGVECRWRMRGQVASALESVGVVLPD